MKEEGLVWQLRENSEAIAVSAAVHRPKERRGPLRQG